MTMEGNMGSMKFGLLFDKASKLAPVPILKVSLAMEASTQPSLVLTITSQYSWEVRKFKI